MNTNAIIITNSGAPPATNDIRALKPPIDIPNGWIWVWVAIGLVTLAVALFFAIKFWRQKAAQIVVPPPIPPHLRARQKLQEALALISQPRPFCIAVSDTVRLYLEERFQFHTPERTTEEFLHELQSTDLLLPDQKQSLGDFLSVCDMVKFARYEPDPPELQALYDSAIRLIDETEPQSLAPDTTTADPLPA